MSSLDPAEIDEEPLYVRGVVIVNSGSGYTEDDTEADEDGEWTFIKSPSGGIITHQRADNSRYQWSYDKGIRDGTDDAKVGTLGERTKIGQE